MRSYTPVVPSKTIPDSRPKWAKCILVFRPKRRKNPTRRGGTYLYSLYKVVPPLPPGRRVVGLYFEVRPQFYIQFLLYDRNREKETKHVHVARQSSSKIIETIIDWSIQVQIRSITLVCEIVDVFKAIQMNTSSMTRFKTFTILWLLSFGRCSMGLFKL